MPDMSILAYRYQSNTRILEEFDDAIRHLKHDGKIRKQDTTVANYLLAVLEPISAVIEGGLPNSRTINAFEIISLLRDKNSSNWQSYCRGILELQIKVKSMESDFESNDFSMLDDIGDSLDAECANLFRRMAKR